MSKHLAGLIGMILLSGCGQAPSEGVIPPDTVTSGVYLLRMFDSPKDDIVYGNSWQAPKNLAFLIPPVIYRRQGSVQQSDNGVVLTIGPNVYCQYAANQTNQSVFHFAQCADTTYQVGSNVALNKNEYIQVWVRKNVNSADTVVEVILEGK